MKLILLLLTTLCLNAQTFNVNTIRLAYKQAAHDSTKVVEFSKLLSKVNKKDNVVLLAYKGASIALLARQAKTIKEKKEGFIAGVSWLNSAIDQAPNNSEIRFIRLGIQENTPKLLKYKGNIEEDKLFLKQQFRYIKSLNLKNHIKDYILQSKVFSDKEKSLFSEQ